MPDVIINNVKQAQTTVRGRLASSDQDHAEFYVIMNPARRSSKTKISAANNNYTEGKKCAAIIASKTDRRRDGKNT